MKNFFTTVIPLFELSQYGKNSRTVYSIQVISRW
jgi:hypothetical protein